MIVIWCMVPEIWSTTDRIFVNLDLFFPPLTRKSKLWKMKKIPEDIIILHMFTKNDIHMMYGSWDMVRDRQNFLQFWAILCPFTSRTTQKIKISTKWKKCSEISSFCTSAPKIMIIYCPSSIACDRCNFYFSF